MIMLLWVMEESIHSIHHKVFELDFYLKYVYFFLIQGDTDLAAQDLSPISHTDKYHFELDLQYYITTNPCG